MDLTFQSGGGYLVGLPLRPRFQLVGVGDELPCQVEPVGAAHPFGEHLHHPGQADDSAVDLVPEFEPSCLVMSPVDRDAEDLGPVTCGHARSNVRSDGGAQREHD